MTDQFHIKRHACGDWMLFLHGNLIAQLPTYDEAMQRAEVEMNAMSTIYLSSEAHR
jgi:hypothetical protein